MMELAGAEGILVSGGALTGKHVDFYDLKTKRCVTLNVTYWTKLKTWKKFISDITSLAAAVTNSF